MILDAFSLAPCYICPALYAREYALLQRDMRILASVLTGTLLLTSLPRFHPARHHKHLQMPLHNHPQAIVACVACDLGPFEVINPFPAICGNID